MYRSRMANTRQTLSMDCNAQEIGCSPNWSSPKTTDMEKMYLKAGKNEDSLELELGASASIVHHNLHHPSAGSTHHQDQDRKSSGLWSWTLSERPTTGQYFVFILLLLIHLQIINKIHLSGMMVLRWRAYRKNTKQKQNKTFIWKRQKAPLILHPSPHTLSYV